MGCTVHQTWGVLFVKLGVSNISCADKVNKPSFDTTWFSNIIVFFSANSRDDQEVLEIESLGVQYSSGLLFRYNDTDV